MRKDTDQDWERRPEWVAARQYGRCLERILRGLPRRLRRRAERPMLGAAVLITEGVVGLNTPRSGTTPISARDREGFRLQALAAVQASRDGLELLARSRLASRPDLLVADELLERIESGVRGSGTRHRWRWL